MDGHDINKEQNSNHLKRKRLKSISYISKYKKFLFIPVILMIVIFLLTIFLPTNNNSNEHFSRGTRSFWDSALNYTSEIPSISFESNDWGVNGAGSWHLDKSAKWTGLDTAQVDFLIKTNVKISDNHLKDIILVLDISGSMAGDKLTKVKEDAKELVEGLLSETGNRVALVVFDTNAEVKSYFVDTSGKGVILNLIDGLSARGTTNYNDALKKMENVIIHDNYTPKENTDLITLFLTDGYPCEDTPNEVATETIIKDTYPYLTINSISYETGIITEALKQISDEQYYASMETLNNILFEASISTENYENFQVVDYIEDEFFYVKDREDITVSIGTIELINEDKGKQKIVWTLSPDFKTGRRATMSINLHLKDAYINNKNRGFYPTNEGEEVISKLPSDKEKEKKSPLTPVLSRLYDVVYENNPPKGCKNINGSTTEQHWAFENVHIKSEGPTCSGYLFKGWEVVTDSVQKVNSDTFQMPTKKVTLRAEWSQHSISKSMKGTVYKKATLYDVVQTNAYKYNTIVTDEYNNTKITSIYYYNNKNNNNVLYAGFCWQIVRTTTTGGVKLIYNGLPDINGTCTTDPTNAANNKMGVAGAAEMDPTTLNSSYWYGDSFNYNENSRTFTLKGTKFQGNYSTDSNKDKYIGQYTCMSTNTNNTCTNLYYISSEGTSSSNAYTTKYTVTTSVNYAAIANSAFRSNYRSPGAVGYMYNTAYKWTQEAASSGSIFANDVTWNATIRQYQLSSNRSTSLDATHHYTCNGAATSCTSVRYYYTNEYGGVYITLSNGKTIEDALYDMIGYIGSSGKQPNTNLNKYDSDVKALIDWWFADNIQNKSDINGNGYANYLEDVVFCNDRGVNSLGGWSQNGALNEYLQFNNYSVKTTLECPNITDQFSTSNTYAKLKYPVGLLTAPEASKMATTFIKTGAAYWLGSPFNFYAFGPNVRFVNANGVLSYSLIDILGVRPVVSLKPGTEFSVGNGTINNPYVIDEPSKSA